MKVEIILRVYSTDAQPTRFEVKLPDSGILIKVCNGVHMRIIPEEQNYEN